MSSSAYSTWSQPNPTCSPAHISQIPKRKTKSSLPRPYHIFVARHPNTLDLTQNLLGLIHVLAERLPRRPLRDMQILNLPSRNIIHPSMNPHILSLLRALRPRIRDRMRLRKLSDLHLHVLLNDNMKRLCMGSTRELQPRRQPGQRLEPAVERRVRRERGDRRNGLAQVEVGDLRSSKARSCATALGVTNDDN